MKSYIGTKIIQAIPGPAPRDMGEHKEGDEGYVVKYPDGYESWSPKSVFEANYREVTNAEKALIFTEDQEDYQ